MFLIKAHTIVPWFQVSRVTESRWSKLYIATACLQAIVIIVLQLAILLQNTQEAQELPDASPIGSTVSSNDVLDEAAIRFRNIKWENLAFCGFQVWFLGMAFDAVSYLSRTCRFIDSPGTDLRHARTFVSFL